MSIKTDFLSLATLIKALPDRKKRIRAWSKLIIFARAQRVLEEEQQDRITRTNQDITDAKDMDIDI